MAKPIETFNPKTAIRYHLKSLFESISNPWPFYGGSQEHLTAWEEQFKTQKVPYAVTGSNNSYGRNVLTLWKRRVV